MSSSQRAKKAISPRLPNEIITEIIQATAKKDRACLCRVSKLFHGLGLLVVNRTVRLSHYASASGFCSGIIANPDRGLAIRSFTVLCIEDPWPDLQVDDAVTLSHLLIEAMKSMSGVEQLYIDPYVLLQPYRFTLLELSFPRLLVVDIGPPDSNRDLESSPVLDRVASFLARHPTLTRVRVSARGLRHPPSLSVRIPLPNLQYFDGTSALVSSLIVRGLRGAAISWDPCDKPAIEIDKIIRTLSLLTTPEIPFFSSHDYRPGFAKYIVAAVSKHIPHTRTFHLRSATFRQLELLGAETSHCMMTCLPRFTCLRYFAMDRVLDIAWDDEEDRVTVEGWGSACSTLEACCLNNRAWKKIDGGWDVYSMADFRVQAGLIKGVH
ncbi:hypothetical protein B0H15DRAFT_848419 [Mycena belliarum]|uniref:F-box domain-containing protein n=1 Tax=Mycena belliarum TaxID=1033014 RepID=A0AAD6XMF1_9AGAR|nr:hypothetical protein B0H15DRAFT_848419 [Mycena belliae]